MEVVGDGEVRFKVHGVETTAAEVTSNEQHSGFCSLISFEE
jgi:hypothetical protein